VKAGERIHVAHCRRIETTVNYLQLSETKGFSPGARVHTVKHWAVEKFGLDRKDAAEHVLQLCGTSTRPTSDTPLHTLVKGPGCALCFDLVPEHRVEG
jgi:hypothetical protein